MLHYRCFCFKNWNEVNVAKALHLISEITILFSTLFDCVGQASWVSELSVAFAKNFLVYVTSLPNVVMTFELSIQSSSLIFKFSTGKHLFYEIKNFYMFLILFDFF